MRTVLYHNILLRSCLKFAMLGAGVCFFSLAGLDTAALNPGMPVRSLTPSLLQARKRFGTSSASSHSRTRLSSLESECCSSPRWEKDAEVRTVSILHDNFTFIVYLHKFGGSNDIIMQLFRGLPSLFQNWRENELDAICIKLKVPLTLTAFSPVRCLSCAVQWAGKSNSTSLLACSHVVGG